MARDSVFERDAAGVIITADTLPVPKDFHQPQWGKMTREFNWQRGITFTLRQIWDNFTKEQQASLAAEALQMVEELEAEGDRESKLHRSYFSHR